ncbi:MAG TPA: right-handed parallel beta-helix repeat-containing protein [Bryobacteraceae bacterium]|nr:right-handed parallel beta-helix repeat-containing protein [Bryobacteraceae bacterium]
MNLRLLPILLVAAAELPGATYYVSPEGADSNAGTAHAPFATLARAAQSAGPGDTVLVRDGTYGPGSAVTAGDAADSNVSPVVLARSGKPDAWITFQAEHRWGAVLDCRMVCDSYFDLANASYIVIQGFVITHGFREGIHSNGAAHHITLRGNRIEYIGNRQTSSTYGLDGMYTSPNCHDFVIDSNAFHDIGRTNVSSLDHGLYLRGWNFTVTNNIFYSLSRGWGIQMADGLANIIIANNTFAFVNPPGGGDIMMWNKQSAVTIRNNIFYDVRKAAVVRFQSSVDGCAVDHNLVAGTASIMEEGAGCAVGANLMDTDPMFVNTIAAPYDFVPRPGSPAAHAGVPVAAVAADYQGVPRPAVGGTAIGALQPGPLSMHRGAAKPRVQK